jgi:hypothetical protein
MAMIHDSAAAVRDAQAAEPALLRDVLEGRSIEWADVNEVLI